MSDCAGSIGEIQSCTMALSGEKIQCAVFNQNCVSSSATAQNNKWVERQEMTTLWEANRHHGVERYQSMVTFGMATESTGESFIFLDASGSDVNQGSWSVVSIEIPLPRRRRQFWLWVVLGFRTPRRYANLLAHPVIQIRQFTTIGTKRHVRSCHVRRKGTATGRAFC